MKTGEKVCYKTSFLRSVSADKEIADRKGIVIKDCGKVGKHQYMKIQWNDGEITGALSCNIAKIGGIELP